MLLHLLMGLNTSAHQWKRQMKHILANIPAPLATHPTTGDGCDDIPQAKGSKSVLGLRRHVLSVHIAA